MGVRACPGAAMRAHYPLVLSSTRRGQRAVPPGHTLGHRSAAPHSPRRASGGARASCTPRPGVLASSAGIPALCQLLLLVRGQVRPAAPAAHAQRPAAGQAHAQRPAAGQAAAAATQGLGAPQFLLTGRRHAHAHGQAHIHARARTHTHRCPTCSSRLPSPFLLPPGGSGGCPAPVGGRAGFTPKGRSLVMAEMEGGKLSAASLPAGACGVQEVS